MSGIPKDQALKHAQDKRSKAKRLHDDANKKDQEIKKLQKEIESEHKKSKILKLGGPAGAILGAGPESHAKKFEHQISNLQHEVNHLREQAKVAEKEAYKWDEKAKFAD
jgi:predicted transcriptional regulator